MKLLFSHQEIVETSKIMAEQINQKFKGKTPIVVCVLKGSAPFHSELIKHIDLDITVDYMQVSSYSGTQSTGKITIKKDLDQEIFGKDVIIVEDIVDTGLTLSRLKAELEKRKPASLTFVSMLDKPSRRKTDFVPDMVGKTIDDLFVIGFGLDLDEQYRNLKDIYIFDQN